MANVQTVGCSYIADRSLINAAYVQSNLSVSIKTQGLPWWLRWLRICLQCRRPGFNPCVGEIPWKRVLGGSRIVWQQKKDTSNPMRDKKEIAKADVIVCKLYNWGAIQYIGDHFYNCLWSLRLLSIHITVIDIHNDSTETFVSRIHYNTFQRSLQKQKPPT